MGGKKISILIADDHPLFREGLVSALKLEERFAVVGEAGNGEELLRLIEHKLPDVAIVDVDMPIMDGIEVARRIHKDFPGVIVVFLTMHRDSLILRSLQTLGVMGYVLKDSGIREIVNCLDAVLSGQRYVGAGLAELVIDMLPETDSQDKTPLLRLLTRSEIRVLKRIARSMTTHEIAAELFVSARTIETHRHNICAKLKLSGTNRLLKFAIQHRGRIDSLPEL